MGEFSETSYNGRLLSSKRAADARESVARIDAPLSPF
jgi:hypothetical protein